MDRFRIRFEDIGWAIQHSRYGIFWHSVGNTVWRTESGAKVAIEKLKQGEAPIDWYKKTLEKEDKDARP